MSSTMRNKLTSVSTVSQKQDMITQNLIELLPNELVCKIMAFMDSKEWLNFLVSYPKYQGLYQGSDLENRIIACDEVDDEMEDRGVEIVLSSNKREIRLNGFSLNNLRPNVFENFKCFTIINIEICMHPFTYAYHMRHTWDQYFDRGKSFTFKDCKIVGRTEYYHVWEKWGIFIEKHFLSHRELRPTMEDLEVNFLDSLSLRDCWEIMKLVCVSLTTTCEDFETKFVITDPDDNEIVSMDRNSMGPVERIIAYHRMDCIFSDMLEKEIKKHQSSSNDAQRKCSKFQFKRDGPNHTTVKLAHDFDIDQFQKDFPILMRCAIVSFPDVCIQEGKLVYRSNK